MGKFVAVVSVLSSVVSWLVLVTSPGLFWGGFRYEYSSWGGCGNSLRSESLWPLFDHQQGSTHPSHWSTNWLAITVIIYKAAGYKSNSVTKTQWYLTLLQVVKSYEDTESVNHEGVLEIGRLRSHTVQQLVTELIDRMEINNNDNINKSIWKTYNHTKTHEDCVHISLVHSQHF